MLTPWTKQQDCDGLIEIDHADERFVQTLKDKIQQGKRKV